MSKLINLTTEQKSSIASIMISQLEMGPTRFEDLRDPFVRAFKAELRDIFDVLLAAQVIAEAGHPSLKVYRTNPRKSQEVKR